MLRDVLIFFVFVAFLCDVLIFFVFVAFLCDVLIFFVFVAFLILQASAPTSPSFLVVAESKSVDLQLVDQSFRPCAVSVSNLPDSLHHAAVLQLEPHLSFLLFLLFFSFFSFFFFFDCTQDGNHGVDGLVTDACTGVSIKPPDCITVTPHLHSIHENSAERSREPFSPSSPSSRAFVSSP